MNQKPTATKGEKDIEVKVADPGDGNEKTTASFFQRKRNSILALLLGSVCLSYFLYKKSLFPFSLFKSATGAEKRPGYTMGEKPLYLELPGIVVNLRQTAKNKQPLYLKLEIVMEFSTAQEIAMVEVLRPRILDQIQSYLRELTLEDLSVTEGGTERLREELTMRINAVTDPIKLKFLLFKNLLVQ